ncbi:hypothetical protein BAE44_0023866 [Dichanthelium oligosanthes]|uniref:Uncharacterized protein n=1 Tax=Dichanthelium oligosanthes TaxID=888268 RepID=A0A1E5UQM5_9POAL|nr:hypothetical protein BAE44_0023866 [Dichanthelium oligosanthes]
MAASVEKLVPMMMFCEAPFDGTLDGTLAPSSSPARGSASSTTSGGDRVATRRELMMEVVKQWPETSLRQEQAQQREKLDGLAILETIALQ